MVRHARDVTRHWNRQDVDQHYTAYNHTHTQTHGITCVFARWSVSVYLCVCDLMISPKRDYQRDFKYQKIHLPLRGRRSSVRGFWGGGGGTAGESRASSNVYPTQGKIQCPRSYSLQRCAYISSSATDLWSHTHIHVITHAALYCRTASKWNVCAGIMFIVHVCYWM